MDALIWYGLVGYLGMMLLLSALLGAQRSNEHVACAHKVFESNIDSLSPISDLAKFMAEANGKAR
jgi:hypothetical protein